MEDIEAGREVCTFCLHERDEEPAKCSATGQPVYFRFKQSKVVESKVPGVSRSTCCAHTDRTVVKHPQRWANDCTERERHSFDPEGRARAQRGPSKDQEMNQYPPERREKNIAKKETQQRHVT